MADEVDRLPESEIVAQIKFVFVSIGIILSNLVPPFASLLVIAGHHTTSNALSRILHLLAQNPEVQSKLRQEIIEARAGGDLPYDELMALPYLDAVVRESLRLSVNVPTNQSS